MYSKLSFGILENYKTQSRSFSEYILDFDPRLKSKYFFLN